MSVLLSSAKHPSDLLSLGDSLAEVVQLVQPLAVARVDLRRLDAIRDALAMSPVDGVPQVTSQPDGRGVPARPRGAGGRPPKLSREARAEVIEAVLSGCSKAALLARRYKVGEATISRVLAARRADSSGGVSDAFARREVVTADRVLGILSPVALNTRFAVVGTSGSGKTYAAKGLLEQVMAGGNRVRVMDPLGVWWGLGKGADEAEPPFPVAVFGGARADVPPQPGRGAAVGRLGARRRWLAWWTCPTSAVRPPGGRS